MQNTVHQIVEVPLPAKIVRKSITQPSVGNCRHQREQLMNAAENNVPIVYPVVVVNVGGTKCCTLLHTWAGSPYASAMLLNRLETGNHQREMRHIEMMLGAVTPDMELSTINVQSLDSQFDMDVRVTKVDKPELLHVNNPNCDQLMTN